MADAGAIIVACGHPEVSERWYAIDTAIAMEHLILAAHELGLGTCWIGAFNESRIKQLLGIPSNVRVVALTPVGYPDESPPPRPRKTLDEVVHWEKW